MYCFENKNCYCIGCFSFFSKSQCVGMSSKDFCRRFLLVREAMEAVPLQTLSSEVKCTKCERGFSMLPELHR